LRDWTSTLEERKNLYAEKRISNILKEFAFLQNKESGPQLVNINTTYK